MQIDTIVTDLDDTLLDGNTSLSPFTLETIAQLKESGIRFIPASGRAASSMRPFINQMNTGLPYIACNGAQLLNPDHSEIASYLLNPRQAKDLIRYFIDKGFYTQVYRDDYFYFAEACQSSQLYSKQTGMTGQAVGDLAAFVDFSTPKVLSISTPEAVAELMAEIQNDFPDISFTISKPYFLEAQPKGISKGTAIQQLSKLLHFSPENTLVFGDSLNDISMYDFTANSVAMVNGRDELLKTARFITDKPNTQDGVAHFIRDHILQ